MLYETYHGVYVNISYSIRCDIKRPFLNKDLQKCQQFLVHYKAGFINCPQLPLKDNRKPVSFELSPANLASGGPGNIVISKNILNNFQISYLVPYFNKLIFILAI